MIKCFIGLDVSSETVGYGIIFVSNGKILKEEHNYFKPLSIKKVTIFESLADVQKQIHYILNHVASLADVYEERITIFTSVEDFLLGHHSTSARTITKLATYNTTVAMEVFNEGKILGLEPPQMFAVATIRASLRKLCGSSARIDKDHVPECLEQIITERHISNDYGFMQILNSKGKNKNKPMKEFFDACDGLAVAVNHAYKLGEIR